MRFDITPYRNVGPLTWSMTRADVEREIGPPDIVTHNSVGNTEEVRERFKATCIFDKSSGMLVEVSFSKLSELVFFGELDLIGTRNRDVVKALLAQDPTAVGGFGTQAFPALGIALTGYKPPDAEIKAVAAFALGAWDNVLPLMKAFVL